VPSLTTTESHQITRWKAAVVGGFISFAIAFGICAGLVALAHQTFPDTTDDSRQRFQRTFPVLEGAAAAVLGFQRVPVTIERSELPGSGPDARRPERITWRVVASPLGGLMLVGLALVVGGRIAHRLETQERGALRSGFRAAIIFATACFAASFLLPLSGLSEAQGPNVSRGYTLTYRPSHLLAFTWPLVWGVVFGSLGAFIGTHGRRWRRELVGVVEARSPVAATALRAASTGLVAGTAPVLLAGVLTAVVGTTFHMTQTTDVLGSLRNVAGIGEGVVLGLPHAAAAGLVASMGVPVRYESVDHQGGGKEYITAGIFGGERRRPVLRTPFGYTGPRFERYDLAVPRYALGALLIAITFTIVTGYRAAAGSHTFSEALRPTLASAVVLTIFLWILGYLLGGNMNATLHDPSAPSGGAAAIGPARLPALVLVPLWTIGGGLVGAFLRVSLRRQTESRT
jgi:hypothetical protein